MELSLLPTRFLPTKDVLSVLNGRQWICSYSGGKDSTTLVTWIEWLRRAGFVKCDTPALVMSDTTVEYPFLGGIAASIMGALTVSGWRCEVVTPPVHQRLYCRIFGIGVTPVHPGGRKMRWCTNATKIDPMKRFARTLGPDVLQLSGVRFGESKTRDAKLLKGCAAGGECGLPDPGEGVYGPIITWKVCKIVEWLGGKAGDAVNALIPDLLPHMEKLLDVYEVKQDAANLYGEIPPPVTGMRFGCIGCPAISNEKVTSSREGKRHPLWQHLRRIYDIWQALYLRKNRCCRTSNHPNYSAKRARGSKKPTLADWSASVGFGPLRMDARKRYFAELLSIQRDAGITLVTAEDEAFIRDCWERKVYPKGWSEADEAVIEPDTTMFAAKGG